MTNEVRMTVIQKIWDMLPSGIPTVRAIRDRLFRDGFVVTDTFVSAAITMLDDYAVSKGSVVRL